MLSMTRRFEFHAAHRLPNHQGACYRFHGHSYFLEITVFGEPNAEGPEAGMIMDFSLLKKIVQETIINVLDHANINDIIDNPTAENMVRWILVRLSEIIPNLHRIRLYETSNSYVEWEGFQ